MKAYINTKSARTDGSFDTFFSFAVDIKEKPLQWQEQGLSFTASGYGSRIPTCYMVRFKDKWRRVYAICYSNCATLYIGKASDKTIVDLEY